MLQASDRDRHLVMKALALAIVAIDAAPKERQPQSDRADMARLLDELAPSDIELELYTRSAGYIINGT